MDDLGIRLTIVMFYVVWLVGIILAKGFWSTFFAIFTFGTWSLWVVIENLYTLFLQ